MCREVALKFLSDFLDEIHENNGFCSTWTKENIEEFKRIYDYEELKITASEIRRDRLKEYIIFFNVSYICEYDIFARKEDFYEALKELKEWSEIKNFLDRGNILCDFHF